MERVRRCVGEPVSALSNENVGMRIDLVISLRFSFLFYWADHSMKID